MTKLLENCACGKCTPTTPTRGKKQVTVAEATAMVKAVSEKLETMMPTDPNAGRVVTGMYLTTRKPDGSGGKVEKRVRVGPKVARQYMPIAKQDALRTAPDHAPGSTPPGPASPDELAALKAEATTLKAVIDDPATGAVDRTRASMRLTAVRSRIEQIETAVHPAPQAGDAPTAGARQYAPTVPYWNEPRVSDSKKAELEAEAAGIRTQLQSTDLTPAQKIRLEQGLIHIERILGKTGTGDAVPPEHR